MPFYLHLVFLDMISSLHVAYSVCNISSSSVSFFAGSQFLCSTLVASLCYSIMFSMAQTAQHLVVRCVL